MTHTDHEQLHKTSATEFDTFLTCPRKWWFSFVIKMPRETTDSLDFGIALHGVAERWLQADDLGRGPALYPDGWNKGLSMFETDLIKRLISKAVDEGVLCRRPGRQVEKWIEIPLLDGTKIKLVGKIDVTDDEGIDDHKSMKNRTHAETPESLLKSTQMLIYGAHWLMSHDGATRVKLRHNQFSKGEKNKSESGPSVKAVETYASEEHVGKFWFGTVEPTAREMLSLRETGKQMNEWADVEGPRVKGACKKYGECPYVSVCGKVESAEVLHARLSRLTAPPQPQPVGTAPVSIFKKKPAPTPAPAAPAASTPAPEQPKVAVATTSIAEPSTRAPWAFDKCPQCNGTGVKNGQPCKACKLVQTQKGLVSSSDFDIAVADGSLLWKHKKTGAAGSMVIGAAVTAKAPSAPAPEPAKMAVTPSEDPLPVEEPAAPAVEAQVPAPEARKPGRKPKAQAVAESAAPAPDALQQRPSNGFLLLIGSPVVRNGDGVTSATVIQLDLVFAELTAKLAEVSKKASFYEIDSFQRKDMVAKHAAEWAKTVSPGALVVAIGTTPDFRAFVEAIRPAAMIVAQGLSAA